MGEKGWEELLTHWDRLRVAFATQKGKVAQIVIVQYEAEIDGQWIPLVRYDMAHGYLHRDVMGPDGTQEKSKIPHANLGEALRDALEELHRQWAFYRRVYDEEDEMTLAREKMFGKNLALARERLLRMIENPEKMDVIPQGARVVSLPREDPELLEANLRLVLELAKDGDERPIVLIPEIGGETPKD